jgi:hypothetical protein
MINNKYLGWIAMDSEELKEGLAEKCVVGRDLLLRLGIAMRHCVADPYSSQISLSLGSKGEGDRDPKGK